MIPFNDEQRRVGFDLTQHCEVWIEAEGRKAALSYRMRWSALDGKDLLDQDCADALPSGLVPVFDAWAADWPSPMPCAWWRLPMTARRVGRRWVTRPSPPAAVS